MLFSAALNLPSMSVCTLTGRAIVTCDVTMNLKVQAKNSTICHEDLHHLEMDADPTFNG